MSLGTLRNEPYPVVIEVNGVILWTMKKVSASQVNPSGFKQPVTPDAMAVQQQKGGMGNQKHRSTGRLQGCRKAHLSRCINVACAENELEHQLHRNGIQ
jgi:hypothetical protein